MQYANINDAQAAMTSDQYVGLNADGTYGLFDRAQNLSGGSVPIRVPGGGRAVPERLVRSRHDRDRHGRAAGEAQAVRAAAVVVPRSVGRARLLRREEVVGVAHVLLFFAWLWMLFFGVLIPINGYEFFAFLILLVLCAMTFVELLALLISSKYGECSRW